MREGMFWDFAKYFGGLSLIFVWLLFSYEIDYSMLRKQKSIPGDCQRDWIESFMLLDTFSVFSFSMTIDDNTVPGLCKKWRSFKKDTKCMQIGAKGMGTLNHKGCKEDGMTIRFKNILPKNLEYQTALSFKQTSLNQFYDFINGDKIAIT